MDKLLVPIRIEALMTSKWNEDEKCVGEVSPNYKILNRTILGDNMQAKPFHKGKSLEAGVHLHFILPDALTHGTETNSGFSYPCIPNRWLVSRIIRDIEKEKPVISRLSWMVESDYLGLNNSKGAPIPTLKDKQNPYKYLGRCWLLDSPPGEGKHLDTLTVYGTGDPTFAAYYPSCRSVLGFHDSLKGIGEGVISYSITGWYSDTSHDLLYGITARDFPDKMKEFGWNVSLPERQKKSFAPQHSLYHGMVIDLEWRGDSYDYPTGKPQGEVRLSAGNNSVEALSALIARRLEEGAGTAGKGRELERFLNALQFDILDTYNELDGTLKVEEQLHKNGFSSAGTEHLWMLKKKNVDREEADVPLSERAKLMLHDMNCLQRELSQKQRQQETVQKRIYEAWHLYLLKYEEESPFPDKKPYREDIEKEFLNNYQQYQKLNRETENLSAQIQNEKAGLEEYIQKQQLTYTVEGIQDQPFNKANDPVLLFSGEGLSRSYVYGEDGRFTTDGTLACRAVGQEISSLLIPVEKQGILLTAGHLLAYTGNWDNPGIPQECKSLLGEMLLLDPESSLCMAAQVFLLMGKVPLEQELNQLSRIIRELVLAPWRQLPYPRRAQDFGGILPSKIGVNFFAPAWNTLYLEWKAGWYPTKSREKPDNTMVGWKLGRLDYSYEKKMPLPSQIPFFTGRTVVTPHSQRILKNAVDKAMERFKGDPQILEALKKISDSAVDLTLLSQSMGGFTDGLVSESSPPAFPLMLTSPNLKGDERAARMTAMAAQCLKSVPGILPVPMLTEQFYPLRAGFLRMEEIQLLNSFGLAQTLTVGSDEIIVSESLTNSVKESKEICLPPRISQEARLIFDWEEGEDQAGTTVCGYLVPDILNHGLMVYNRAGEMLGTVQLIRRSQGKKGAVWLSAPLAESEEFERVDFKNEHLHRFIQSHLTQPKTGPLPLENLLSLLDKRQSQIAVQDGSYSRESALLCGRPTALVRGRMTLETKGEPAWRKGIEVFGAYETNEFEKVEFPIAVGDPYRKNDTVIGYYQGRDPKKMYDHIYTEEKIMLNLGQGSSVWLTLLMEPVGDVTVKSGILPVQHIRLPEGCCKGAMERLYMGFAMNPLLSSSSAVHIPFLEAGEDSWSWAVRDQDGSYREISGISGEAAVLAEEPVLMDGYLIKHFLKKEKVR